MTYTAYLLGGGNSIQVLFYFNIMSKKEIKVYSHTITLKPMVDDLGNTPAKYVEFRKPQKVGFFKLLITKIRRLFL